jgi:hypothetical protein
VLGIRADYLYQWFANGDHAAGNTGGVLACDLLIPAVMIVLARRSQRLTVVGQPAAGGQEFGTAGVTSRAQSQA